MEIVQINSGLCEKYERKIKTIIFESVHNSHFMDSFTMECAEKKYCELKEYLRANQAIVYGVIANNELIGFLWGYEFPFRDDKKRIYISVIYIDKAFRGNHLGAKLLKKICEYAKKHEYGAIFLHTEAHNLNAQYFYKMMGFKQERIQLVKYLNEPYNVDVTTGSEKVNCKDTL